MNYVALPVLAACYIQANQKFAGSEHREALSKYAL